MTTEVTNCFSGMQCLFVPSSSTLVEINSYFGLAVDCSLPFCCMNGSPCQPKPPCQAGAVRDNKTLACVWNSGGPPVMPTPASNWYPPTVAPTPDPLACRGCVTAPCPEGIIAGWRLVASGHYGCVVFKSGVVRGRCSTVDGSCVPVLALCPVKTAEECGDRRCIRQDQCIRGRKYDEIGKVCLTDDESCGGFDNNFGCNATSHCALKESSTSPGVAMSLIALVFGLFSCALYIFVFGFRNVCQKDLRKALEGQDIDLR